MCCVRGDDTDFKLFINSIYIKTQMVTSPLQKGGVGGGSLT